MLKSSSEGKLTIILTLLTDQNPSPTLNIGHKSGAVQSWQQFQQMHSVSNMPASLDVKSETRSKSLRRPEQIVLKRDGSLELKHQLTLKKFKKIIIYIYIFNIFFNSNIKFVYPLE